MNKMKQDMTRKMMMIKKTLMMELPLGNLPLGNMSCFVLSNDM